MSRKQNKTANSLSELRVIAGRWRGRKIRFPADGIRPTGDRVRETLFNWLGPLLPGARCLDMFAGSGALGIEALSRGAAHVTFIEKNPVAARAIDANLRGFDAGDFDLQVADALITDLAALGAFDVVFLDPPFSASGKHADARIELGNLCTLLENSGALAGGCRIYLEMDRADALPDLPTGWHVAREKMAGQVRYALAQRAPDSDE